MKRKSVADVEVDHRELEDEHDVCSPPLRFKFMMFRMLSMTMCIQIGNLMLRIKMMWPMKL